VFFSGKFTRLSFASFQLSNFYAQLLIGIEPRAPEWRSKDVLTSSRGCKRRRPGRGLPLRPPVRLDQYRTCPFRALLPPARRVLDLAATGPFAGSALPATGLSKSANYAGLPCKGFAGDHGSAAARFPFAFRVDRCGEHVEKEAIARPPHEVTSSQQAAALRYDWQSRWLGHDRLDPLPAFLRDHPIRPDRCRGSALAGLITKCDAACVCSPALSEVTGGFSRRWAGQSAWTAVAARTKLEQQIASFKGPQIVATSPGRPDGFRWRWRA